MEMKIWPRNTKNSVKFYAIKQQCQKNTKKGGKKYFVFLGSDGKTDWEWEIKNCVTTEVGRTLFLFFNISTNLHFLYVFFAIFRRLSLLQISWISFFYFLYFLHEILPFFPEKMLKVQAVLALSVHGPLPSQRNNFSGLKTWKKR